MLVSFEISGAEEFATFGGKALSMPPGPSTEASGIERTSNWPGDTAATGAGVGLVKLLELLASPSSEFVLFELMVLAPHETPQSKLPMLSFHVLVGSIW